MKTAINDYVNSITTTDLIKDFNESNNRGYKQNPSNTFSYLTKDSIVISINVPYPIGNHVWYEFKYQDLQNNINKSIKITPVFY